MNTHAKSIFVIIFGIFSTVLGILLPNQTKINAFGIYALAGIIFIIYGIFILLKNVNTQNAKAKQNKSTFSFEQSKLLIALRILAIVLTIFSFALTIILGNSHLEELLGVSAFIFFLALCLMILLFVLKGIKSAD